MAFTLDLPGEPLRGGAVTTDPAGHEEKILGGVANASLSWARACKTLTSVDVNVDLTLALARDGKVREARPRSPTPLGECLARAAAETRLSGVALAADTAAELILAFSAKSASTPTGRAR